MNALDGCFENADFSLSALKRKLLFCWSAAHNIISACMVRYDLGVNRYLRYLCEE